jgi:hypothetical protein
MLAVYLKIIKKHAINGMVCTARAGFQFVAFWEHLYWAQTKIEIKEDAFYEDINWWGDSSSFGHHRPFGVV